MERRPDREARRRAVLRRRRIALTVLGTLAVLLYTQAMSAVTAAVWPSLPFPDWEGLMAVTAVGFVFGLLIRRWWAVALALVLVPIGAERSGSVLGGGVIALLVAAPYAALGLAGGVGLMRLRLRRQRVTRRRTARAPRPRPAIPAG